MSVRLAYWDAVEAIVRNFSPPLYGHWAYPTSFEDGVRQSAELALLSALTPRQRALVERDRRLREQ